MYGDHNLFAKISHSVWSFIRDDEEILTDEKPHITLLSGALGRLLTFQLRNQNEADFAYYYLFVRSEIEIQIAIKNKLNSICEEMSNILASGE